MKYHILTPLLSRPNWPRILPHFQVARFPKRCFNRSSYIYL